MTFQKIAKVEPEKTQANELKQAAEIIKNGGLVIIPTETVYGIAVNALNEKAIGRLTDLKARSKDRPFSILIPERGKIEEFARNIPLAAYKLADAFWPGPLTMILAGKDEYNSRTAPYLGRNEKDITTIGLRVPNNKLALKILELVGVPVACPSANLPGKSAPKNFEDAIKGLESFIDFAIDSGPCELGIESTVVDLSAEQLNITREQAIGAQRIKEAAAKKHVLFVCTGNSCRSVMAEALLKKKLREVGRGDVDVSSAGIIMVGGLGPTEGTKEVLKKEGVDVSSHRSQKVTKELIKKSDIVIAMERMHEERILQLAPEVKSRVFLLKEFAKISDDDLNVADPLGKSLQFYEQTMVIIKEAIERIVNII